MLLNRSIHLFLLLLLLCAPASGIVTSMQNSANLEIKNDYSQRIHCLRSYQNNSEIATLKPISTLKLGDKVLAKSEWKAEGESLSYEAVTDIMLTPNQERTLVHINLSNGQKITTTDGHPFKTTEGWRDAILLKKGGKLLLKGDSEHDLEITDISHSTEKVTTFNLEVANAHTFFVGGEGVLVHNGRGVYVNNETYDGKTGNYAGQSNDMDTRERAHKRNPRKSNVTPICKIEMPGSSVRDRDRMENFVYDTLEYLFGEGTNTNKRRPPNRGK